MGVSKHNAFVGVLGTMRGSVQGKLTRVIGWRVAELVCSYHLPYANLATEHWWISETGHERQLNLQLVGVGITAIDRLKECGGVIIPRRHEQLGRVIFGVILDDKNESQHLILPNQPSKRGLQL